jgi:peptidoglycan/LPS O-acetylase OafA/YrhL
MKINYRPEIDGLRAIAVFAVIIYHADISLYGSHFLSGGFLGVDIFFVISGYLISSIILKEIYYTKNFSFKFFYERRVRRIIPALLFVTFCSIPFAYFFLLSKPIIDFSKSIITSIFFTSNIYFNFTGNIYGTESTLLKPFLHTWSLSVEEQFYILFPIFLFIFINFFKKYLLSFLLFGILLSISFSQYLSIYHPGFNFYQIFSRGFELLLGSLLAHLESRNRDRGFKSNKILNHILMLMGLSLIIYSLFFFHDKMLLPSLYSLVPLTGVCLILWFSNKNEFITKILSNKIFVFFGIISYSLYLFHYPIFAFLRNIYLFDQSIYIKILSIIFCIIISIFSFYYVEKPFRDKKKVSLKKLLFIISVSIFFLLFLCFYTIKTDGIKNRLPEIFHKELENVKKIEFSKSSNFQDIVLIGDSHAQVLEYHLNDELKKYNFNLTSLKTRFYIKNFNLVGYISEKNYKKNKQKLIDKDFIKDNEVIDIFLKKKSNLIVVLHHRWALRVLGINFDNEEGFRDYKRDEDKFYDYLEPINTSTASQEERVKLIKEGTISQINNIVNQGHKLILIYPVPEMGFNLPKLIHQKYIKENLFNNKHKLEDLIYSSSFDVYKKRNKEVFEILDSVQSPNIYRVYPHNYFCDKQIKNRCLANDKENLFYFDGDHLSLYASKYVVNDVIKIIKQIEVDKKNRSKNTESLKN